MRKANWNAIVPSFLECSQYMEYVDAGTHVIHLRSKVSNATTSKAKMLMAGNIAETLVGIAARINQRITALEHGWLHTGATAVYGTVRS